MLVAILRGVFRVAVRRKHLFLLDQLASIKLVVIRPCAIAVE